MSYTRSVPPAEPNPFAAPVDDSPRADERVPVELTLKNAAAEGTWRVRLEGDRVTLTGPDDRVDEHGASRIGSWLDARALRLRLRVSSDVVLELPQLEADILRRYAGSDISIWGAEAARRATRWSPFWALGLVSIAFLTDYWFFAAFALPPIVEAVAGRTVPGRWLLLFPVGVSLLFAAGGTIVLLSSDTPVWMFAFLLLYLTGVPSSVALFRFFGPVAAR